MLFFRTNKLIKHILKFRPPVSRPFDGALDKDGGSLMGDAIAMTDEDVLTVHRICSTMACGLECLLVTFDKELAATIAHIDACRVEIGAFDTAATTYGNLIGTLTALTAVVPGYEEIIPAIVLKDERSLDSIGASEVGSGILWRIRIDR